MPEPGRAWRSREAALLSLLSSLNSSGWYDWKWLGRARRLALVSRVVFQPDEAAFRTGTADLKWNLAKRRADPDTCSTARFSRPVSQAQATLIARSSRASAVSRKLARGRNCAREMRARPSASFPATSVAW